VPIAHRRARKGGNVGHPGGSEAIVFNGSFIEEDAIELDISGEVGGPIVVGGDFRLRFGDRAVGPAGVDVAVEFCVIVGVQLGDGGDEVGVWYGAGAGTAVGIYDYGKGGAGVGCNVGVDVGPGTEARVEINRDEDGGDGDHFWDWLLS